MITVRQLVLDYIHSHHNVTVREIAQSMQMTQANARHHLAILRAQGLIEIVSHPGDGGRGRPANSYRLAAAFRSQNLGILAGALLEQYLQLQSPANQATRCRQLAKALLASNALNLIPQAINMRQRLLEAVKSLNALNYQARWEARASAPYLLLGYCPYFEIIADHPEICQIDHEILQMLIGQPVRQTARLIVDEHGETTCHFTLA
jgi:predicted ArsR family transcriptional regulator